MSGTPQYPGPDPDDAGDPFDRPPDESGERRAAASTPPSTPPSAPAQWTPPSVSSSETEQTAPITPDQLGYWERKAAEEAAAAGGPPSGQQPPGPTEEPRTSAYPSTEYPAPAPQAPPYGGYGQTPPYGGYYSAPQPHPRSTTSLVLGLIGLIGGFLCCLPLVVAPFAWAIGGKTVREIDASNGQLGGRSNAQAGYIMGIIGTVLIVLVLLVVVGFVVLVGLSADQYSDF